MRRNNLWCLSTLLLAAYSPAALGMNISLVGANSQSVSSTKLTARTNSQQATGVAASVQTNINASSAASKPVAVLAQALPQAPKISLTKRFSGFSQPVQVTHAGDRSNRIFVVEKTGRIRLIKKGVLETQPFLDISSIVSTDSERGLLSVAFPPNYAQKQYFYVYYTNASGDIVIARYRATANPDLADANSQEVLLTINHQQYSNHNGGQLAFGADGYLYIGTGDGGGAGDPLNNGQNPGSLLGKILRIDVESGVAPYVVPPSNPFVQTPGFLPEIWALGLRNPWRFSFDRHKGDLYIGDVGQGAYEEINFQSVSSKGGENYGWNILEASQCFNASTCDRTNLVLPVAEYDHSQGSSVTGGIVYRGQNYLEMFGTYFYADFVNGNIWGLKPSGTTWQNTLLLDSEYLISSIGEDQPGNLYITDYTNGDIYAITSQKTCTITGTPNNDSLTGTAGNDVICGLEGNDKIDGGGGIDLIYGDAGNDTIDGGAGNDVIQGSSGNDQISGDDGDDTIYGSTGNDALTGNDGNDFLGGGIGNDTLNGGLGTDRCVQFNGEGSKTACE